MADEKPLTKSELVATLKEAGFVTKDDLKELRKQVKEDTEDVVHNQLTEFYAGRIQPEIDKLRDEMRIGFDEMRAGFKQVDQRLHKLEADVSFIKDDIKGLVADFSTVPKREEFNDLKTRVRRLEIARGDV